MTALPTTPSTPTLIEKVPPLEPSLLLRVLKRRWLPAIPFIVGIVWICLHPVVSIMTGELKCRGWFIDENSLDAGHFRIRSNGFKIDQKASVRGITSLCDAIETFGFEQGNVECFRNGDDDDDDENDHNNKFHIAKLVPVSNSVTPISEAIVLVIPASNDWLSTPFPMDMMHLLRHLASAPWLAKTVLLVAPTTTTTNYENNENNALDGTVREFLDAYLNQKGLPPSYTTAMIRNLLVLDMRSPSSSDPEEQRPSLFILPQGRKGLLPNLDLVFLTMMVYSRVTSSIMMHPYYYIYHRNTMPSWIPYPRYTRELFDMLLFMRTMSIGPYPPHAAALEYGIDSLTIQSTLSSNGASSIRIVEPMELILHALSNLHERLHHSVTQYLLPSPIKFVSHAEYLIPHILLVLPLALQAMRLILVEMTTLKFDFMSLQITVWVFCAATCVQWLSSSSKIASFVSTAWNSSSKAHQGLSILQASSPLILQGMNTLMVILYVGFLSVVSIMSRRISKKTASSGSLAQSLLFVTCLCTIYMSLPLILGHVSLATPTVLFWSVITWALSSSSSSSFHHPLFSHVMTCIFMILTWPPLVVQFVFGYYSPYVCMVHLPLHLLTSIRLLLLLTKTSKPSSHSGVA